MNDTTATRLYAIRQLSTGYYMPATAPSRQRQRGFTHDKPTPNCVPRLFTKRQYAELALRAWLKGVWEVKVVEVGGYYGGEYDEVCEVKPVEGRRGEDMEIVEMMLVPAAMSAWPSLAQPAAVAGEEAP